MFNPTLQANVRFDQPVDMPSPLTAVTSIIQGLGIGQGNSEPNNEQDRFNRSWQRYTQSIGREGIAPFQATSAELRGFQQFDPARSDTAIRLAEQAGAQGFAGERASRDADIERFNTPSARVYQAHAAQAHPDDQEAQIRFVETALLADEQSALRLEQLQRDASAATARGTLSQEAWDVVGGQISRNSLALAGSIAQAVGDLGAGQSIRLGDVADPTVLAELRMSPDFVINSNNLVSTLSLVRNMVIDRAQQDLSRAFPGQTIQRPTQEYMNNVLGPLDALIAAAGEEQDPVRLRNRFSAGQELRVMEIFSQQGLGWLVPTISMFGDNFSNFLTANPELNAQLGRLTPVLQAAFAGQRVLAPEEVRNMSQSEQETLLQVTFAAIDSVRNRGDVTPQVAETVENFVNTLPTLFEDVGGRLPETAYSRLLSFGMAVVLDNGAFSMDTEASISQIVQHDLSMEISTLRQIASQTGSGLRLENGQVVLVPARGQSSAFAGTTAPLLQTNIQPVLTRLNSKLAALNTASARDILGDNFASNFEADLTLEPQDFTSGSRTFGVRLEHDAAHWRSEEGIESIVGSLIRTEARDGSPDAWDSQNDVNQGHFGRLQFSPARLNDARRAGVMPQGMTPEQFLQSPETQVAVERWHVNDIVERIQRGGLMQYVGRSIQGVEVTVPGMIAVAHLGGYDGLEALLRRGDIRRDAYGTSTLDYLARHANPGTTGEHVLATGPLLTPTPITPSPAQLERARTALGVRGVGDMPEGIQAAVAASSEATGPISTTAVEQSPVRTAVGTEDDRPAAARQQGQRTPLRIPREITDLIDNLTGNEQDQIIEYLRSIRSE